MRHLTYDETFSNLPTLPSEFSKNFQMSANDSISVFSNSRGGMSTNVATNGYYYPASSMYTHHGGVS